MPHQAETQSPAITSATTACTRRKRLILLCCEDLRPVACGLEDALRSRGWQVDVEFGADARPWVSKVPPMEPSVRVLCVPGTVDRVLAQQLRAAYRPDPDADLHILGVDDSPGLVLEIERLAGVKHPHRRSLHASPRLAHATLIETQARTDRSWQVGVMSALAAFAITFGGMSMQERSTAPATPTTVGLAAGLTSVTSPSVTSPSVTSPSVTSPSVTSPSVEPSRIDDPVLSNVAFEAMDWDDAPVPEEDFSLVIDGDEPIDSETTRRIDVLATPLAAPPVMITDAITITNAGTITDAAPITDAVTITGSLPTLPPGFLQVAGLPLSDTAEPPRQLPPGFLPVAGMTAPRITTVDPFDGTSITTPAPLATVDPFAPPSDVTAS